MIQIQQLTKKYNDKVAVDNLTMDIHSGVVTGFLGPNGAGKSTTMRMIIGLASPTKGAILIDGKPYEQLKSPLSKIGALIDSDAVNPKFTARQHLKLIATAGNLPTGKINQMLSATGLQTVADKLIGEFSFGMRQRLGIAGALMGDPETLILDEPFNGLDVDGIKWLRKLTKDLAGKGKAVLISSHLMGEVQEIAGRVIVLAQGKLITDMDMDEMSAKSLSAYIHVKTNKFQELKSALEREGAMVHIATDGDLHVRNMGMDNIGQIACIKNIALHELSKYQPSLEQLFSELTKGKVDYHSDLNANVSEDKVT